jgi:hypothetical protein
MLRPNPNGVPTANLIGLPSRVLRRT